MSPSNQRHCTFIQMKKWTGVQRCDWMQGPGLIVSQRLRKACLSAYTLYPCIFRDKDTSSFWVHGSTSHVGLLELFQRKVRKPFMGFMTSCFRKERVGVGNHSVSHSCSCCFLKCQVVVVFRNLITCKRSASPFHPANYTLKKCSK